MHTVGELVHVCHQLAPFQLAEDYDNVGLLIGNTQAKFSKILCALDLNEEVLDEAINSGAQCIITHHPFLFRAIKRIDTSTVQGRIIQNLMKHDISVIAMHTNLDIVSGGINDFLSHKLELENINILRVTDTKPINKVCIYVPITHEESIRDAMIKWNPTTIGNYVGCAFSVKGTGTFIPQEGSNPTIGQVNNLEKVMEVKMECMVAEPHLLTFIQELKKVHPYEEMAYDVYRLEHMNTQEGIGRWGNCEAMTVQQLIEKVKEVFCIPYVRVTGELKQSVKKIAICSGSGSSLIRDAAAVADVYITGDLTFHEAQSAMAMGLTVLDIGHYASENIAMPLIKEHLENYFKEVEILCSKVDGEVFKVY